MESVYFKRLKQIFLEVISQKDKYQALKRIDEFKVNGEYAGDMFNYTIFEDNGNKAPTFYQINSPYDIYSKKDPQRAIASQSALRVLMRQDTTTIKKVATEFNLSEYEQHFLLTCDKGEALVIADQNHVSVKVVASDKEHPLLTTDPREVYT